VLDRLRSVRAWQAMKREVQSIVARVRQMKADMEARMTPNESKGSSERR
jgi:hypothetical protein